MYSNIASEIGLKSIPNKEVPNVFFKKIFVYIALY